jgi:hypothetical protein
MGNLSSNCLPFYGENLTLLLNYGFLAIALTQGHRDRDIADHLIISESTVKFHMNNLLKKLKAQTRYQALHEAIVNGWIQ